MYFYDNTKALAPKPFVCTDGNTWEPHSYLPSSFRSYVPPPDQQSLLRHLSSESSQRYHRQPSRLELDNQSSRYDEAFASSGIFGPSHQSQWRSRASASSAREDPHFAFQLRDLADRLPVLFPGNNSPISWSSNQLQYQQASSNAHVSLLLDTTSAQSQVPSGVNASPRHETEDVHNLEVEWQAASVATEMALQVLRSDDISNETTSSPSPEAAETPDLFKFSDPPPYEHSAVAIAFRCDEAEVLPRSFPSSGDTSASLDGFDVVTSSYSENTSVGQSRARSGDQPDPDSFRKRGKARMSQEKRRRLARRKEREALLTAHQHERGARCSRSDVDHALHYWPSAATTSCGPTPNNLSTSSPRSTVVKFPQTIRDQGSLPLRDVTAAVPPLQSNSMLEDCAIMSFGDDCVSSDGSTQSRSKEVLVKPARHLPRGLGMTSTSASSVYPSSHFSAPFPSSPIGSRAVEKDGGISALAYDSEALDKVEHLRQLQQLAAQMLAAKQRPSMLLPPPVPSRNMSRHGWRPACSYVSCHNTSAAADRTAPIDGHPLSALKLHADQSVSPACEHHRRFGLRYGALHLPTSMSMLPTSPAHSEHGTMSSQQERGLIRLPYSPLPKDKTSGDASFRATLQPQNGSPGEQARCLPSSLGTRSKRQ